MAEIDNSPKLVSDTPNEGSLNEIQYQKPVSKFTRVYRSPLFNVIIVGLISFTQPGIWNALNSQFSFDLLHFLLLIIPKTPERVVNKNRILLMPPTH